MAGHIVLSCLCSLVIIQSFAGAYSSLDPIAILPPLEVRPRYSSVPRYLPRVNPPTVERLDAASLPVPQQQQILHRNPEQLPRVDSREAYEYRQQERDDDDHSSRLISDFLRAIGVEDTESPEERDDSQANPRDYQYSPYPQYPVQQHSQSYGENRPYGPVPPSVSYGSSEYLQPIQYRHPTFKTLDLVKPFASKVSTKIGGLLSIVLALLGGSGGGLSGLSGFKDILVHGIIKPLISLKGGLKELVSKLSIPVLSLVLINVELLLTIWWLWDDCPQVQVHPVVYPTAVPTAPYSPPAASYSPPAPQAAYNHPLPSASNYPYSRPQPVYSYNSNSY